ncbi:O-Antigen ligase [compost metagenome]
MGSRQLQVGIGAGYILLLVVSCVYTGFYEGRGMYPWMAAGFLIMTVMMGLWVTRLREERNPYGSTAFCKKDTACSGSGRGRLAELLLVIPPFIMAGLYGAHLLTSPVSMQGTLDQALRWAFYGVFAAGLTSAVKLPQARAVLRAGPAACAAILTAAGLAAVYGLAQLPHAVLRTASAELSAAGARLGGLLEYPNTLGAVFGVLLLERLASLSRTDYRAAPLRQALGAALTLGCAASLLLTESRGAWLCTAAGWAAVLALAGRAARRQLLLQTAILGGGGLWVYRQLAGAGLAPAQLPGLAGLAGAAACTLALFCAARGYDPTSQLYLRRSNSLAQQRLRRLAVAAACCAWAGLALALPAPGSGGAGLVRTGTSTVSARLLMYRDAMDQIGYTPLWGRGGEVWRSVYRSIQSQPYVGAQVHSGYIDILLGLGIIGLLVILTWIIGAGLLLFQRRSRWFAPFIVLVLHAGTDFDMSYGLIWLILIWIAVIGTNEGPVQRMRAPTMGSRIPLLPRRIPTHIHSIHPATWIYSRSRPFHIPPGIRNLQGQGNRSLNFVLRLIARAAAIVFLMLSILSLGLMKSEQLTGQALHLITLNRTPEARHLLKRAIQLGPYRFVPRLVLSSVTDSADAERLLREGINYNPLQAELWWALGRVQSKQGDPAAIPVMEKAALLDRYNSSLHTAVLSEFNALALRLDQAGRPSESVHAVQAGLTLFRRDQLLAYTFGSMRNVRNDRKFRITEAARQEALLLECSSSGQPFRIACVLAAKGIPESLTQLRPVNFP